MLPECEGDTTSVAYWHMVALRIVLEIIETKFFFVSNEGYSVVIVLLLLNIIEVLLAIYTIYDNAPEKTFCCRRPTRSVRQR
jgi:hypothetical protein